MLRCADRSGGEIVPGCDFGDDPDNIFDSSLDICEYITCEIQSYLFIRIQY